MSFPTRQGQFGRPVSPKSYGGPVSPTRPYGGPVQPPQYAQPQPSYGHQPQPSYGHQPQPTYGQPLQPQYGQQTYGQAPFEQQYGHQSYAQPSYGQPAYIQPVAAPQYNQTPAGASTDWFSQSGFTQAVTSAAVSAAVGGDGGKAFTGLASSVEAQSKNWVQSRLGFLKQYFNVTHAYVRWKLLYVLVPFLLMRSSSGGVPTRTVSRDIPDQGVDEDSKATTTDGLGLRLLPGRRPDLYIPLMGFISFVLVSGLSNRGSFHPDDLYNKASLGLVLVWVEIFIVKGAAYVLSIPTLTLPDIAAVCGYKFTNLCAVMLALFFLPPGRSVWVAAWLWAALTAGLVVRKGLLSASGYYASVSQYMGTGVLGNTEKVIATVAGAAQILWCWFLMPGFIEAVAAGSPTPPSTNSFK